jgi:hypothetical protein
MLCEAFRRLGVFGKIEYYRYFGFGSTYFGDFILFYKALNISNMISIEKDVNKKERFMFNRPFKCIAMEFGESSKVLAKIKWDIRSILWLDYDGGLESKVFTDLNFFSLNAPPGSVIVISVNAHPINRTPNDQSSPDNLALPEYRLQQLKAVVGEEKMPPGIDPKNLEGWGTAKTYRTIIDNEILKSLAERNGERQRGNQLKYQQLFNFNYQDGAKMLTVGGLLYDEGQEASVCQCAFHHRPFFKPNEEPYLIEVPNLTFKEIRHLDEQLPKENHESLELPAVPEEDIKRYAKIYRYFPTFTEADI